MAHDVFIAYSSKDKPIADGICASLEAAKIPCWITPRDLARNRDARKATEHAIAHSRVLVLVFSAHANGSDEITQQLFLAAKANAVIIPVKIDDTVPVLEKQYYLGRPQWHTAQNPPTAEQLQLLVERVQAVRAVPISKPKRIRLAWFDFAPSVLIVLGVLAGLVLLVASAQLGLLRLPIASAAPTLIPSRAITPSAADQARAFAAPILAAIANKPPNFQDDFGDPSSGWRFFQQARGGGGYINGEFSMIALPADAGSPNCSNGAFSSRLPDFSDLVLEIDERTDLSSQADLQVQFRKFQNTVYALVIDHDGYLGLLRNESQQTVNLLLQQEFKVHRPSDGNHVQIIMKGARIAVSANGEPIAVVTDPQPLPGGNVSLEICNNSSTPMDGRFDNIKIWDISDLPSPP